MVLKLYGNEVESVFQLLGNHENDITKSIAFALSRCPIFLDEMLRKTLGNVAYSIDQTNLFCQRTQDEGITDVEIVEEGLFHVIFEAKRGFLLPSHGQLQKYANDLNKEGWPNRLIWTLSDVPPTPAEEQLEPSIDGISIHHLSYFDVRQMAKDSFKKSNHKGKRILEELIKYLEGITSMTNKHSNTVYVVPISGDSIKEHDIERAYHCPVGNGFLKEPENYLGFRYWGKLQYINHVEKVEYYKGNDGKLMFKFFLGPDIVPPKTVRTGGKYQGTKFYCDIDLLFTSDTIIEARKKTEERNKTE